MKFGSIVILILIPPLIARYPPSDFLVPYSRSHFNQEVLVQSVAIKDLMSKNRLGVQS